MEAGDDRAAALTPPLASPLPPPPPMPPQLESDAWPPSWKVPGQLSAGWRLTFGLGWALIIACNGAVWETSRIIGLSTWWLGADAEPRFILLQLLPFYAPILTTVSAISNWRYAPFIGIGSALVGLGIGLGDLDRVRWIAVVELVIAAAGLLISVASLAGMYRHAIAEPAANEPVVV